MKLAMVDGVQFLSLALLPICGNFLLFFLRVGFLKSGLGLLRVLRRKGYLFDGWLDNNSSNFGGDVMSRRKT